MTRLIDADAYKATMRDVNGAYWEDILDNMMPTVDAVPVRRGKWLKAYGDHEAFGIRPFYRYCSCCNEATVFPYNYCPNCGATMDAERKEE